MSTNSWHQLNWDKSTFNVLQSKMVISCLKDIMTTAFYLLSYIGYHQFLSVFGPAVNFDAIYFTAFFSVFLLNFYTVSWLVYLYLQYHYVFYPNLINVVPISRLRLKSLVWKLIITIFSMCINVLFPFEDAPVLFQLLTDGKMYKR